MTFNIQALSDDKSQDIQAKIDAKTKPLGALGKLEVIALQIARIQETIQPSIKKPTVLVFAADHGIAAKGVVNAFPQAVTAQMVYNFLRGGAAINSFCKRNAVALEVIDAGVNHNFEENTALKNAKIDFGTRNYEEEPAMTFSQCQKALHSGAHVVQEKYNGGTNTIGLGEMGIGNTSSAALLMSAYTGLPLEDCVGSGTGLTTEGLQKKLEVLQAVQRTHKPDTALDILATFGGFEIAMITGALLKAAELKMTVVIDGFIVSAAVTAAHALHKNILDYCIFAHESNEQGHKKLLHYLGQEPILQLGLRLGEGTGAALAFPILQSAVGFMEDMATFESASVSKKL